MYRIKKVEYDNGKCSYFLECLIRKRFPFGELYKKIGNPNGYETYEIAKNTIKEYHMNIRKPKIKNVEYINYDPNYDKDSL